MTSETWTYHSSTEILISGNYTSIYKIGMKIKLTQTSVKYFIVTNSTYSDGYTTLTINGKGKYTLANESITSHAVTDWDSPSGGFPLKDNVLTILDGVSEPSTISGNAQIYVDTTGNLCIKFGDGTVKTIISKS